MRARSVAEAWRDGWRYGFRDAIRLAARELGPESWRILDELAERYGGDDVAA